MADDESVSYLDFLDPAMEFAAAFDKNHAEGLPELLVPVFHNLRNQLNDGVNEPIVKFSQASAMGRPGIKLVKDSLEKAFNTTLQIEIDLFSNTIKAIPIISPPAAAHTIVNSIPTPTQPSFQLSQPKIPRPPNLFIIYRRDMHEEVVKQNPGLHNNDISKIIGNMWKQESREVKEQYRLRAEAAKTNHTLLHPNYTYQPRKPSERKKRMTKNKLAKFLATAGDMTPDIQVDHQARTATFDAGTEDTDGLVRFLHRYRRKHQRQGYMVQGVYKLFDEQDPRDVVSFAEPGRLPAGIPSLSAYAPYRGSTSGNGPTFIPAHNAGINDATYEATLQRQLQEDMDTFFDFNNATADS